VALELAEQGLRPRAIAERTGLGHNRLARLLRIGRDQKVKSNPPVRPRGKLAVAGAKPRQRSVARPKRGVDTSLPSREGNESTTATSAAETPAASLKPTRGRLGDPPMTWRQQAVLRLLLEGLEPKQMAARLGWTHGAAQAHLRHVCDLL